MHQTTCIPLQHPKSYRSLGFGIKPGSNRPYGQARLSRSFWICPHTQELGLRSNAVEPAGNTAQSRALRVPLWNFQQTPASKFKAGRRAAQQNGALNVETLRTTLHESKFRGSMPRLSLLPALRTKWLLPAQCDLDGSPHHMSRSTRFTRPSALAS